MKKTWVWAIALLTGLGVAVVPSLIPTGPTTGLDASSLLQSGQLVVAAGVIFLGGLLTSLTPCVYPLIPITVGVFGARKAKSRAQAFGLTSAYVGGMGLVFSALGVAAALSGKAFGSVLGNAWVLVALSVFMLALAASMFGAFELALPTSMATRLNSVGGGGVIGALLMGSVAGFLAAPCTGPVLTGVLAWVSQTKDPVLGGLLLFIYALGIGVPFFLIGVFTVRLPKGGQWMEWVKSIFGIVLLAMAVSYLRLASSGLDGAATRLASALAGPAGIIVTGVLALAGVALGALHLSFKEGRQWLPKGVGVALVLVAIVLRTSLPGEAAAAEGNQLRWAVVFDAAKSGSALPFEKALADAKAACKPVLIDFFAEWCAACKELDQHTYVAKDVVAEGERFVNIKVDGTTDNEVLDKLYEQYGVQGLPTVAFIDPSGTVLTDPRVTGFLPPEKFLAEMRKVNGTSEGLCTASR